MMTLNPVMRVDSQMIEAMTAHQQIGRSAARARARDALALVGIPAPEERLSAYPHQLSGGMRQRVAIATAMLNEPDLIIADEPTTALDVTIQAQILELMRNLSRSLGVALVIITHNLGVVARYADRVNVMYAGRIVESGTTEQIFTRPGHPYTIGLMASVPRLDLPRSVRLVPIEGQPPDLARLDGACSYRPRCGYAIRRCAESFPPFETVGQGHRAACFRTGELAR
jgi:oligopeptide/dipeptide ABC transporter ATP-binding protein